MDVGSLATLSASLRGGGDASRVLIGSLCGALFLVWVDFWVARVRVVPGGAIQAQWCLVVLAVVVVSEAVADASPHRWEWWL